MLASRRLLIEGRYGAGKNYRHHRLRPGKCLVIRGAGQLCGERLERAVKLLPQCADVRPVRTPAQLDPKLVANMPNADVGTQLGLERAALGSAKHAAGMDARARDGQPGRGHPCQLERGDLGLGKQVGRRAAAAVASGEVPVRQRVPHGTAGTRGRPAVGPAELTAELAQSLGPAPELLTGLPAAGLSGEARAQRQKLSHS